MTTLRITLLLLASALLWGCHANGNDAKPKDEPMTTQIAPFLMFQDGRAEEAMNYYVSLFDDAEVISLERHGPGGAGAEGSIMLGVFRLNNQRVMCTDSPPVHEFGFTPSVSLFVDCASESELDTLFASLSDGGSVMMPPGNYGFSRKFAFLADRFGVSWQLNLPDE